MVGTAFRPTFIAMIVTGLLLPVATAAQGTFPPSSFQNLQVLPKDASAGVVVAAMKGFANNLGVRCQFCHIGEEGLPLEQFDFVSDDKATKRTARTMMRLTDDINRQLDAAVARPSDGGARVTCMSCHRGKSKPTNLKEP
jgi:Photosynthetic reaction centre cytochrome C subunit